MVNGQKMSDPSKQEMQATLTQMREERDRAVAAASQALRDAELAKKHAELYALERDAMAAKTKRITTEVICDMGQCHSVR